MELTSMLFLPPALVMRAGGEDAIRARWAVQPKVYEESEDVEPVDPCALREDGWLGIPPNAGVEWIESFVTEEDATIKDGRTEGLPAPMPRRPRPRPGQRRCFDAVHNQVTATGFALFTMTTGGGKTVVALDTIARLGRRALVMVPSNTLADQWRDRAVEHLGLDPRDIGILSAGVLPANKKLVIAVVHNIVLFDYVSKEYVRQFGTVVFDELHRFGARMFSRAMAACPAMYRIGLTATPSRKDGCWRLVTDHLGTDFIEAQGDSVETHCYGIESTFALPPSLKEAPFAIQQRYLSKHRGRNKIIEDAVMQLFHRGRRFLVTSTNVEQLQGLQSVAVQRGIPAELTGFYTGFLYRDLAQKGRARAKMPVLETTRRKLRESDTHRIIYGTYAQMKEGVDIPWADAGIDAMPLADGVQLIGRIRRRLPGKLTPCWFTIIDVNIPRLFAFAKARLRGMEEAGVTLHYHI